MRDRATDGDRERRPDPRRETDGSSNSSNGRSRPVESLQRTVGNRAVQKLHERGVLQPKLTVNEPDDRCEREADRVADQVVGNRDPDPRSTGAVDEVVQRSAPEGSSAVDEELDQRIRSLRGGGRPLPASVRSVFEPRFEHDFGDVRVHTGPEANDAVRSIDAEAFTIGRDVFFATGTYRPHTTRGDELLAHELTHVVQQRRTTSNGECTIQRQSTLLDPLVPEGRTVDELALETSRNVQAFAFGFVQGAGPLTTVELLGRLGDKLDAALSYTVFDQWYAGIEDGVVKEIQDFFAFLLNLPEALEEIVLTIYEIGNFLIHEADPEIMTELGRYAGRTFGEQLVELATLEDGEFAYLLAKNVVSPFVVEILFAVLSGGLATAGKLAARGLAVVAKIVERLPSSVVLRIRKLLTRPRYVPYEDMVSGRVVHRTDRMVGLEPGSARSGPLPPQVAESFSGGRYVTIELDEPTTLYRVYNPGQSQWAGGYWSLHRPEGSLQARIDLALLPDSGWSRLDGTPFQYFSEVRGQAGLLVEVEVKPGTRIHVGEVGGQNGPWVGGKSQVMFDVDDPDNMESEILEKTSAVRVYLPGEFDPTVTRWDEM